MTRSRIERIQMWANVGWWIGGVVYVGAITLLLLRWTVAL